MRRVLAIDGGGILGLMPALVLAELERRSGRPCRSTFDLLAGTSTGGIIACGLAVGLPASRLVSLYENDGPAIFAKDPLRTAWEADGLRGPRYDSAPLEAILRRLLGGALLSSASVPLLVPCARCDAPPFAWWFRSWRAKEDHAQDFPLWEVARATSAAPTYFPAAEIADLEGAPMVAVDGGLFANDPEDRAIQEARRLWPGEPVEVLSLGTGKKSGAVPAKPDWGGIDWLPHIVGFMMTLTEADAGGAAALAGGRYRIDFDLEAAMDDASPANVAAMKAAAAASMQLNTGTIDRFAS